MDIEYASLKTYPAYYESTSRDKITPLYLISQGHYMLALQARTFVSPGRRSHELWAVGRLFHGFLAQGMWKIVGIPIVTWAHVMLLPTEYPTAGLGNLYIYIYIYNDNQTESNYLNNSQSDVMSDTSLTDEQPHGQHCETVYKAVASLI